MTRFFTRDLSDDQWLCKLFYSLEVDGSGERRVMIEEWNDLHETGRMTRDYEQRRELSESGFRSEFAGHPEILAAFEQAIRDRQS
jgi:hypothetical protein